MLLFEFYAMERPTHCSVDLWSEGKGQMGLKMFLSNKNLKRLMCILY